MLEGNGSILEHYGVATASLNVAAAQGIPIGTKLHHAYLVFDNSGKLLMASNSALVTFTR